MKSILMLGQSNMAGRGFLGEVPTICNENILMLRNGKWQIMSEPINYDREVAGIGLAGSFAAMWCKYNKNEKLGLIPCADGGSSIDDWSINKALFKHAVSEAKFAQQDSEIIGVLWHQGENDSYNGLYKEYYAKLCEIVNSLRTELKITNVPFVIGELGHYLGKSGLGSMCSEYKQINSELLRFSNEQSNCYFVTAKDLTANPDGIHINAVSQRRFGVRYYEAFSKKQNILVPIKNEMKLLNSCVNVQHTKSESVYLEMLKLAKDEISYNEFEKRIKQLSL